MHIFQPAPERLFVILSAGNLATTQAIINRIETDMEGTEANSLKNCEKMLDAAQYVSRISREEQTAAQNSTAQASIDTSVSLIFGGQIQGALPSIYMMYSAGNFISNSEETPFLQIGETKYGKPILDRIVTQETSLEDAARCAIVSMDSTIRSNATVGPPIEVLVYENDSFNPNHYIKLQEDDEYLRQVKQSWNEAMKNAFSSLPKFDWENRSGNGVQVVNMGMQNQNIKS
jgi:putative proteasome-type protease